MGGMHDEMRGSSKIKTYLKYAELVEEFGDTFQDHEPNPNNKKLCKKLMVQDPYTGEWVLPFRLHSLSLAHNKVLIFNILPVFW